MEIRLFCLFRVAPPNSSPRLTGYFIIHAISTCCMFYYGQILEYIPFVRVRWCAEGGSHDMTWINPWWRLLTLHSNGRTRMHLFYGRWCCWCCWSPFVSYIEEEMAARHKRVLKLNRGSFPVVRPPLPMQDNGYDCGVFALRYAKVGCERVCFA